MDKTIALIRKELKKMELGSDDLRQSMRKGNILYVNGQVLLLSTSKVRFEFAVDDEFEDHQVTIFADEEIGFACTCKAREYCHHSVGSLLRLMEELLRDENSKPLSGKAYSRAGMIRRVIQERRQITQPINWGSVNTSCLPTKNTVKTLFSRSCQRSTPLSTFIRTP